MRVPVDKPYTITTKFGVPDKYAKFGRHSGTDYAVPLNRDVLSPVGGTIEYAKRHSTGGNMLMIKDAKGNYHRLMHNNSFVKKSGRVEEGQVVAKAGTTGLSTGVHVHHDIATTPFPISFSQFLDPNKYNDKQEVEMPTRNQVSNLKFLTMRQKGSKPEMDKYSKLPLGNYIEYLTELQTKYGIAPQPVNDGKIKALKDKIISFVKGA